MHYLTFSAWAAEGNPEHRAGQAEPRDCSLETEGAIILSGEPTPGHHHYVSGLANPAFLAPSQVHAHGAKGNTQRG